MAGDFIPEGQPFEMPLASAEEGYSKLSPTTGAFIGATLDQGPSATWMRESDLAQSELAGPLGAQLRGQRADQMPQGAPSGAGLPDFAPPASPVLQPDEYNKRFAPDGTKIGDKPMPESVARVLGRQKADEIKRESIFARYSDSHSFVTTFGAGLVGFMLDPVNDATMFIPGMGEETVLAGLGRVGFGTEGAIARTAARIGAGAVTGAVAQAPLSAFEYSAGLDQNSDYSLRDAMRDMMFGAAGGAILHAGFGAIGDAGNAGLRALAERRGVSPDAVVPLPEARVGSAARGEDIVPPPATDNIEFWKNDPVHQRQAADIAQPEPAPAPAAPPIVKPPSLIDFLSKVGIKDDGGELAHMGIGKLFIPGKGRLVRKNGGVTLDQAREMAVQAGYLQDAGWNNADVQSTSTVDDFLQALAQDHNALRSKDPTGRVYSWADRGKASAFLDAAHQERANAQISDFADMAKEDGHAITDKALMERAAAHYHEHGGTVDNAIDRAAMALAEESPDVRASLTETIPGWEDAVHGGPVRGGGEKPAGQGVGGAGTAAEGDAAGARGEVRDAGGAGDEANLPVEHQYSLGDGGPKEHAPGGDGPTVFHGTLSDFRQFDTAHLGKESDATRSKLGFFFTDNPNVARTYASADRYAALKRILPEGVVDGIAKVSDGVLKLFGAKPGRQEGRVISAKILPGKQFVYELPAGAKDFDPAEVGAAIAHAKERGYDSVIIKNMVDDGYGGTTGQASNVHVVFKPEQIQILDHGLPAKAKAASIAGADATTKAAAMKASVAQMVDGRPIDVAPVFDHTGSAADLAQAQRDLHRNGFAPGMAQPDFLQMDAAVYGEKTPAVAERPATSAQAAEKLAQSQLRIEALGELAPEDRAELDRTLAAIKDADLREQAYQQAGECLTGAFL